MTTITVAAHAATATEKVVPGNARPSPNQIVAKMQVKRRLRRPARLSSSQNEVKAKPNAAEQNRRPVTMKSQCMVYLLWGEKPRLIIQMSLKDTIDIALGRGDVNAKARCNLASAKAPGGWRMNFRKCFKP
jgi:hypothetical protein